MKWLGRSGSNKSDVDSTYRALKVIHSRIRWRRLALILLVVICYLLIRYANEGSGVDHIAEIDFRGEITSPSPYRDVLNTIENNPHIKGVLIRMNSGGGQAAESEYLYNRLQSIKSSKKIPVVVFIESAAASGAYMISLTADYVIALNTSVVGSIGAMVMVPDIEVLLSKIGVSYDSVKSGVEKGEPTGFSHMDDKTKIHLQSNVDQVAEWFVHLVKSHRKLKAHQLNHIASGGVYTGRESYQMGLVDQIGGEDAVRSILRKRTGSDYVYKKYSVSAGDSFMGLLRHQLSQSLASIHTVYLGA